MAATSDRGSLGRARIETNGRIASPWRRCLPRARFGERQHLLQLFDPGRASAVPSLFSSASKVVESSHDYQPSFAGLGPE